METPIHEEIYRGHTIKIIPDCDPESPRDYDNLGTMTCWHRRYQLGDQHSFDDPRDFLIDLCGLDRDNELTMTDLFQRAERQAVILPLFLYDHSGLVMNTTGYHCPWDSGQVGYAHASLADIRKEYSVTRVSAKLRQKVTDVLRQEVATFSDYISGNVYGYVVERDGEEIDACWGFIGDSDGYVLQEARSVAG